MAGRGGAGEIVDLVDLEPDRVHDVVPQQLEIRPFQQMRHVGLLAGEEIVQADDVVLLFREPLAEMRAQETGAAGDQNAFGASHAGFLG